ncbi:hypothetical protein LTR17_023455, partial [Elasticomyces elasticus]
MGHIISKTLPIVLLFSLRVAGYIITSVDVGQSNCGATIKAGELLTVRWALDNATAAIGDTCYIALRSPADTTDDTAYVVDAHVPCAASSFNLLIPKMPSDSRLLYNGSDYY